MEWNLSKNRLLQNKRFIETQFDYEDEEQPFSVYLGMHPNLYDGIPLTGVEITKLNYHFWHYRVEPQFFGDYYRQALMEVVPRYNIMKSIEFNDEILEMVNDKTVRHIVDKELSDLLRNVNNKTTSERDTTNDNKNANKDLPMETTGTTFEGIVDWSNGGKSIAESKDVGKEEIEAEDIQWLTDKGTRDNDTFETIERTTGDIVDKVDKIWNYLVKPKSFKFLCSSVAKAFILVE